MKVIMLHPHNTVKLYHRKAGDIVQITRNDGKTDPNFYLVCEQTSPCLSATSSHMMFLVNVKTGVVKQVSVSVRTVLFDAAELWPLGTNIV